MRTHVVARRFRHEASRHRTQDLSRLRRAVTRAAILAVFADDVEFRLAEGHPYRGSDGAWVGKDAIATKFFAVAGPEWDGWSIGVDQTVEAADAVVVEGRYTGRYKPTGRPMDVQVCHVWRFRGDRRSRASTNTSTRRGCSTSWAGTARVSARAARRSAPRRQSAGVSLPSIARRTSGIGGPP